LYLLYFVESCLGIGRQCTQYCASQTSCICDPRVFRVAPPSQVSKIKSSTPHQRLFTYFHRIYFTVVSRCFRRLVEEHFYDAGRVYVSISGVQSFKISRSWLKLTGVVRKWFMRLEKASCRILEEPRPVKAMIVAGLCPLTLQFTKICSTMLRPSPVPGFREFSCENGVNN
jgi:hypothetical protein